MAILQYNTKNESFLKMYTILKDFGIKNCDFFMILKDESLIDVDPLAEDLSPENKLRVHNEITNNLWYFLREVVRIPTAGERRPFELTRATLALCWAMSYNLSTFVVLPRQCYKTYTICAMYIWLFYWACKNTEFMMFSYAENILKGNLNRIKEIRETLPDYLNLYNNRTDKDNSREMKFTTDEYYNHIRIKAPSKSPEEASKVGRGFSTPCMWFDELNFIPQIGEIYDSSSFAYKTVAEIAKKNGSHYHRIMSSSVGRLNEESGVFGFNFLNSSCAFTETMYDYDIEVVRDMISKNSTNSFLKIEFMYYDLGKPDTYLEEMRTDSTSEDAFQREVLNRWQNIGTEHPLGRELIDKVSNEKHAPSDVLVIDDVYFLKLYRSIEDIDFNHTYVVGIDTGGNLLHDFSTLVVVDPTNYEVVATLRSNQFSTNRFSKCVKNILINVFSNAVAVIERNYIGIALCDSLIESSYALSSRIYFSEDDKPGFVTSSKTRPILYKDLLRVSVINQYKLIHDSNIINEIVGLEVSRNGRIDHAKNGHDDTLMAYLFTRWFLAYAKNAHKYIDVSIIGSKIEGEDKIDQERVSNKGSYVKTLKHMINNNLDYVNPDGTIDMHNIVRRQTEMLDVRETGDMSDSMDNINIKLYTDRNNVYKRNVERLENESELLSNEEDLFDTIPTDLKEKVDVKEKQVNSKMNYDFDKFKLFLNKE
ncbi:MAG: hypothetical protein ACRC5M_04720 [Anaeroplasmataceae bacterium]